eukprot:scaffold159049_cov27-Tisochrysis_lutea.AAC.5
MLRLTRRFARRTHLALPTVQSKPRTTAASIEVVHHATKAKARTSGSASARKSTRPAGAFDSASIARLATRENGRVACVITDPANAIDGPSRLPTCLAARPCPACAATAVDIASAAAIYATFGVPLAPCLVWAPSSKSTLALSRCSWRNESASAPTMHRISLPSRSSNATPAQPARTSAPSHAERTSIPQRRGVAR